MNDGFDTCDGTETDGWGNVAFREVLISAVWSQGGLYRSLFPPSSHPSFMMSSSSFNPTAAPLIVGGDSSAGTQVPVVPNRELRQGAFCIVNPDFWGAGDRGTFNGTMNYTEVRWHF